MDFNFNGVLPVNKPAGFSSAQITYKIKQLIKKATNSTKLPFFKVGHVGSLDPLASGVLPIMVGYANRLHSILLDTNKIYQITIQFGYLTDTLDLEGKIVDYQDLPYVEIPKLKNHLSSFCGQQSQIPPLYSAVHYQNKRLYQYARKKNNDNIIDTIDLSSLSRSIIINHIKILDYQLIDDHKPCYHHQKHIDDKGYLHLLKLEVSCSKGSYMRKLSEDIANSLKTCATTIAIDRTKTALIDIDQCIELDKITNLTVNNHTNSQNITTFLKRYFIPIDDLKLNLNKILLCDEIIDLLTKGITVKLNNTSILSANDQLTYLIDQAIYSANKYLNNIQFSHNLLQSLIIGAHTIIATDQKNKVIALCDLTISTTDDYKNSITVDSLSDNINNPPFKNYQDNKQDNNQKNKQKSLNTKHSKTYKQSLTRNQIWCIIKHKKRLRSL